jgi:hypothetical protein
MEKILASDLEVEVVLSVLSMIMQELGDANATKVADAKVKGVLGIVK